VRKFGKFLEEYASQLKDVEDALEESNGDSWDLMLDPVAIEVLYSQMLLCKDGYVVKSKELYSLTLFATLHVTAYGAAISDNNKSGRDGSSLVGHS